MRSSSKRGRAGQMGAGALLVAVLTGAAVGQGTSRVSITSGGAEGDSDSYDAAISAAGRFVAYSSYSTNLVPRDTNNAQDVFIHDRQSGVTELVSIDSGGAQANGDSNVPSISADGRYVSFDSGSSNLVGGDTNGKWDVFVRDRQSGTTERVSVATAGAEGNDLSSWSAISGDGRFVAFWSKAHTLVSGDTNAKPDHFVHDRQTGTTERVSLSSSGAEGNGACGFWPPSISADGRFVAFSSFASNLVSGDTNRYEDIFVRDRQGGTTVRVSVDSLGAQGNGTCEFPSISADGRCVVFHSEASNLVSGDTKAANDIFVHDRGAGIGTKYCTANANSTGFPADLSAAGSASSGAGNLMLESSPVPNQNGIFFHGANPSQVPFGNGFLCATGGIIRGAVVAGTGNAATYVYDNSDAKHSVAAFVNTTRNFQYWFRDPMGGGAFFNTSNAISIAVLP